MRWLLRMSRLARHPPSERRLRIGLAVILVCLLIYGAERAGLWPDWAAATRMRR